MIFSPELAEKVMRGLKTVTRRPAKGTACRYQPGRDYAVQPGRGKKAIGRIRILDVRGPEPVKLVFGEHWAMEGFELEREGFTDRYQFARYWESLYGEEDGNTPVWRIEFEVAKGRLGAI